MIELGLLMNKITNLERREIKVSEVLASVLHQSGKLEEMREKAKKEFKAGELFLWKKSRLILYAKTKAVV